MSDVTTEKPFVIAAPALQKRPRSRALKYLLRFVFALLVLLIVLIIAVQIVLHTDVPRRMIIAQLQRSLGLRVAAKSASVTWSGDTILHDVAITLPLAEQPLASVPSMKVVHTV